MTRAAMDSSPSAFTTSKGLEPSLPTVAGVKRPAPSLLPPFEPLSSSPGLPRPAKRQAASRAYLKYPTPVPTSSTGILSSSPPRVGGSSFLVRPEPQRTVSSVSERAPLSDLRSVELNENGETLLMGRSSNSSHYQLSANRLISRVHVKARYIPAEEPLEPNKIEIACNGWNGLKLHVQGQTWELAKGDTFTSDKEGTEIMIDVQDARVLLQWPNGVREKERDVLSDWEDSPTRGRVAAGGSLHGSPLRRSTRIGSPESPTPANVSTSHASLHDLLFGDGDDDDQGPTVEIYEDGSADEQELPKLTKDVIDPEATFVTQVTESFSSELSDPQSDEEKDPDEENDPIVHSFGPFGANLSNRLASFTHGSPIKKSRVSSSSRPSPAVKLATILEPLQPSNANSANTGPKVDAAAPSEEPSPLAGLGQEQIETVSNHVANQLAFSRLSSTPLSTIMNNLPAEEKKDLSKDALRSIIESTACIGVIPRQGKDAAGKPLESEYYYIPEMDTDEQRRLAVTDGLRKPSLRNCRKQHKQYFWKRPKTP
ncbi:protein PLM2 [Diplogelasinospora grovesii]|uniref:Protein PLM2 n=1 Tax=Diplogelasinospora grovesii TaxID=303347 RepID=A0AAN6NDV7_9PEZI|nr:protein PLM2 [Diplogelasinospora grovesii]